MPDQTNDTPETAPEGVVWEIDFFDATEQHIKSVRINGLQAAQLRDGCGFDQSNPMFGEIELDFRTNSWLAQTYKIPEGTVSAFIGARATKPGIQYAGLFPPPIEGPPIATVSMSRSTDLHLPTAIAWIIVSALIDLIFVLTSVNLASEDEAWRALMSYPLLAFYFIVSLLVSGFCIHRFISKSNRSNTRALWILNIVHVIVVSYAVWIWVLQGITWFPGA